MYYFTRHDSMTQAVNTFVALNTGTDGGTPGAIRIPQGATRIVGIMSAVCIDGAITIDVAQNFTLRLSGTALRDGVQEVPVGGIGSVEVGTSVGLALVSKPAFVQPTD